jgi:hypothetical protein
VLEFFLQAALVYLIEKEGIKSKISHAGRQEEAKVPKKPAKSFRI